MQATKPASLPEIDTMAEVDQARILAFAFVEAARIVEERANFAEFETPEIAPHEEDQVRTMLRTVVSAKLKHAGLMVLLNTAKDLNKAKGPRLNLKLAHRR